jgi:hypothetical protein
MCEYAAGRREHPVVYLPDISLCTDFDVLKHACVFAFLNKPEALRALCRVNDCVALSSFVKTFLCGDGALIMDQWNKLSDIRELTLSTALETLHGTFQQVTVVRSQSANLDNRDTLLAKQSNEITHAFYSAFTQLQVQAMFTNYQQLQSASASSSSSSSSSAAAAAAASASGSGPGRVLTEEELSAVEHVTGTCIIVMYRCGSCRVYVCNLHLSTHSRCYQGTKVCG